MNYLLLSLIFVSPLFAYASHLLALEFRDPLFEYHDSFRKGLVGSKVSNPQLSQDRKLLYGLGALFLVLVFSGSGAVGLLAFLMAAATYLKWRKTQRTRGLEVAKKKLELEFPAFVELFSILMVAGESPSLAFLRLSEVAEGELASQIRISVTQMKEGGNLSSALERLAYQSQSSMVRRFTDSLIIALERGTPLADVLHRQVEDVRKYHQAEMLKRAGKAEIALMIPVVFLILPISVLFALWPSYLALGQNMI